MKTRILRFALFLAVAGCLTDAAAQERQPLRDPQLLRLLKRHPAADRDGDGRLTQEEWLDYEEGLLLRKDMNRAEEMAVRSGSPSGIRVPPTHREVSYGPLPEQKLNLWVVPSEKPTPLIIHIHGGGFVQGSKQDSLEGAEYEKLLAAGVSYASIQYRFQSKSYPLAEVLRCIARSVQFLRYSSGKWNLDPERIATYGSSAGGNATAWLGMRDDLADPENPDPVLRESSRIQAAWAIAVATTMDVWEWPTYNPAFPAEKIRSWIARWGYDPDTDPNDPAVLAWRKELHLPNWASPDDAPMVIFNEYHAENVAHNPHGSLALYEICKAAGMDVSIYLREILKNTDQAPDPIEWMIGQLKKTE